MQGVITQVSNPNSSTACTKALKNNQDTRIATLYLLRIHLILLQTDLAWDKLFITAGQSLSSDNITRPIYLEEFTFSRWHP